MPTRNETIIAIKRKLFKMRLLECDLESDLEELLDAINHFKLTSSVLTGACNLFDLHYGMLLRKEEDFNTTNRKLKKLRFAIKYYEDILYNERKERERESE